MKFYSTADERENMGVELTRRIDVFTRGGTQGKFRIRPARPAEARIIALIYNSVLDPRHESGLMVQPEQIEARLLKDPRSVYLGTIDDEPASIINVVRRSLGSRKEIPRTHQALTDNDYFTSVDPDHGNMWFCPWVAVLPDFRGYKATIGGIPRSLGQLHVLRVHHDALRQRGISNLFAYSRPADLRTYLGKLLGVRLEFTPAPTEVSPLIRPFGMPERLIADETGIRLESESGYLVTIHTYWHMNNNRGRKLDTVFDFHAVNGAYLCSDLVMPNGHPFDGKSLGYRTVLQYLV